MATDRTIGALVHEELGLSSANDNAFSPTHAPVKLRTLGGGASRVQRALETLKHDELWRGDVFDPYEPSALPTPVYVRIGQAAPLVAELLCAVVARAIGLPAPEPFAVLVEPGSLAGSSLAPQDRRSLYVGTLDVGGTTFSQLLREDSAAAQSMLRQWKHLIPVTVLDEWLANTDRNLGNILYAAQALHIIDHAEAFGGSTRELFPLAEITHDAFTNKLAGMLEIGNASRRQSVLNAAHEWLAFVDGSLDVDAAVASANVQRWQTAEEESELLHFIKIRLTITHQLLCNRLGHPQLALSP